MHIKHLIILAALLLAPISAASPAQAGGVVTVCDEAHLLAALAGGGTVTFACSGTITLTNTITIAADTTIDGSGQNVTISGNNAVRILHVHRGIALNLVRLTFADGRSGSPGGGGIYNDRGTITVINSTFHGNSANSPYDGGAIYNLTGSVTVSGSEFSDNHASSGGAIYNVDAGMLAVTNTSFSNNQADGYGGGIFNIQADSVATISNCTFSGNRATWGGGIYNFWYGTATVRSSTFANNNAPQGGGIYNDNNAALTVSNSTFFGNENGGIGNVSQASATAINCTFSGNRLGVWNDGGTMALANSIVAYSPSGANCSGAITDGGGNLSYPDATCPGINVDPLLGPLQINGGTSKTMDLALGSVAIDAANDATCAAMPVDNRDQRGFTRPVGAHCDIGAVEYLPFRVRFPIILAR